MVKERIHRRMNMTLERPDMIAQKLKHKVTSVDRAMTTAEIESNCWHLILHGTKTTVNLLTAAVSCLARKPAKLHKLTAEVRGSFSSPGDITFKSTAEISYLDAVLHECFRLAPPVAGSSPRIVDEDMRIRGYSVPKGVGFVMTTT